MLGRSVAIVGLLLSLGTNPATAQPIENAVAPSQPTLDRPDWTSKPTGADFEKAYARMGLSHFVVGSAVIQCTVTSAGSLEKCAVIAEKPPNLRFGPAALGMAPRFRMKPVTRDGHPVEGSMVNIPIRFCPSRDACAGVKR